MRDDLGILDRDLDRRGFLKVGALAGGALLLEVGAPALLWGEGEAAPEPFEPVAFLTLHPDDRVVIRAPVPEIGQGVRTALPMILAEELGAEWSKVEVEQAPFDDAYGPRQVAGGSASVRVYWSVLRRAGATARELLLGAAAETWDVPRGECRAIEGEIRHPPSSRSLRFGALVERAARLPVAEAAWKEVLENPPLKSPEEFTLLGTPRRSVDQEAIVTGAQGFGSDVRVDGMLFAAIERCPVFGGSVRTVDGEGAKKVRGVDGITVVPPGLTSRRHRVAAGAAVLGRSTAAVLEGRRRLDVSWDLDETARAESTPRLRGALEDALRKPGEEVRSEGDAEGALEAAATRVEAVYELPFLAHAPMEPMVCTASVRDGSCELWAPTQAPAGVVDAVSAATGIAAERVSVHQIRAGGGFGRRLNADHAAEAAYLSQQAGAPVQVFWDRADELANGFYRPMSRHRLRGALDAEGRAVAWLHHQASTSKYGWRREGDPAHASEVLSEGFPIHFVPNLRLEYTPVESPVPRGSWRSVAENVNVFAIQCFVDELAEAAGRDPVDFRLELLGEARDVPYYNITYDSGRLRRAVEVAAERSGWGRPLPAGRGRGIAFNWGWQTVVAEVVEVEVDDDGRFSVERVTAVVDPGVTVNPLGLEAQVMGGILDGIASVASWEITLEAGRVEQRNFDHYPLLRYDQAPEIDLHLLQGDDVPGGMGEPPVPPLGPALCSALAAATGRRPRRLPLHHEGFRSR